MFINRGYCNCCCRHVLFMSKDDWFRDHYKCLNCGSIPRERAIMYCIDKFVPAWKEKVIHESSPAPRGASARLRAEGKHYISSQFLPEIKSGSSKDGILCEDLESLSFEDNSIDLHVTQDVFEHLFNPDKALKEIYRTLRPGGVHIFTTPLVNKNNPTQWYAKKNLTNEIEYLVTPPEYHGNPISEEGSLVTVHWGYDIVDYIYSHTKMPTHIVHIDNLGLGIRAEYIEVLINFKSI